MTESPLACRVARAAAGIAAALIILIFIGETTAEGFGPLRRMSGREAVMMAAFFTAWLGLLLGWKRALPGGLLTVGGLAAFYLSDYLFSGTFPRGIFFFILLALPGMLLIYCGLRQPG